MVGSGILFRNAAIGVRADRIYSGVIAQEFFLVSKRSSFNEQCLWAPHYLVIHDVATPTFAEELQVGQQHLLGGFSELCIKKGSEEGRDCERFLGRGDYSNYGYRNKHTDKENKCW